MKTITYLVAYSIGNREFTAKISSQKFALQKKLRKFALSNIFKGGEKARQLINGHFLCPNKIQSSVPCGALMRPQPLFSGCWTTGSGTFLFTRLLSIYCLTF